MPADPTTSRRARIACGAIVESALEGVEWEVAGIERQVHAHSNRRILRARQLVADAMVGAGVEVTRGARGATVAAHLHVPEERLAEGDERSLVRDVAVEPGRLRHGDATERGDGARRHAARSAFPTGRDRRPVASTSDSESPEHHDGSRGVCPFAKQSTPL